MPHASGDQLTYVGIAMKLDKAGLKQYSLYGIGVEPNTEKTILTFYYPAKDAKGDIINFLEYLGAAEYDQPLFHAPPLFPYLLMLSHKLFAPSAEYQVPYNVNWGYKKEFLKIQYPFLLIPVISSVLLVFFTFFLGRLLFNNATGLLAAYLLTVSPIGILLSRRLYSDGTLALFVLITLIFAYLSFLKNNLAYSFMCGIFFGLALLTKGSALILVVILLSLPFIFIENGIGDKSKYAFRAFFKIAIIFIAAFLITFSWYKEVIRNFGTPFYHVYQKGVIKMARRPKIITSQPWFRFLVNMPYQLPPFIFGYMQIITAFIISRTKNRKEVFLGVWFLSFLIILAYYAVGPDMRYLLPACPALAILSSRYIAKVRNNFFNRFKYIDIVIAFLLVSSFIWSMKIVWLAGDYYTKL